MSNITYQLFKRQFYIGPSEKLINPNWKKKKLQNGLILSYCPSLPVTAKNDTVGNEWVLIGDAIQSKRGELSPDKQLATLTNNVNIEEIYASWAGRWILVGKQELHIDAVGLLGSFYRFNEGNMEVASVPGFISGKDTPETYIIKKSQGINYYSTPDTGFSDISKVLPSQLLNLKTGEVSFRSLECKVPKLTYEETIQYLSDLLIHILETTYKKSNKKIVLALTAGYDSRLLMAVLNKAKIPYEAITFHYPTIDSGDISIPKKLASISKIKYRLIRRKKPNVENWHKYKTHSTGHAIERDQDYMLYQQFNELEGDQTVLLRAGGFEIASSKMRTRLPKEIVDGSEVCRLFNGNEKQAQSLSKWVNWVRKTKQENIDWRDRYYWEQRVTGWLACTEQALDLVNIERLVPSNSLLFYNIMLNIPEEIRLKKKHQIDMIKLLSPELLKPAFNPKMGLLYRNIRKFIFKIEKYRKRRINLNTF